MNVIRRLTVFVRNLILAILIAFPALATAVFAQDVIPLKAKGGLHAAYVVPNDTYDRVDVQLIVLSGSYDDPGISGIGHLTEHLAAFSADDAVLRRARARDVNARIFNVSTLYTNSGSPKEIEVLLQLSRAVLDRPVLPPGFAESEIKILHRETHLRERNSPYRWLKRKALENLYGSRYGRANNEIEDLPRLNLQDAYKFHETHYVPSNVTLIVSGKIDAAKAEDLVARYFGDTESSPAPEKPWLKQKPDPSLRKVERLSSDRLSDDIVMLMKFVDFEDQETSIEMQGEFFMATSVLNNRISKALIYDDTTLFDISADWFFSKGADVELTVVVHPMPGVDLNTALSKVEKTLGELLDTPIQPEEIAQSHREQLANAKDASRQSADFLDFLHNVAGDGFPPVSPGVFADMIENTSDDQVIEFARKMMEPSATSVVLAQRER
ncbi:MAG: insulinase family protein [Pseudomonadota bacterium]